MLGEVLYRRAAGIFFALLIMNFSANFSGITYSFFDNYVVDVENIDKAMADLALQSTNISAEENQEEEGESSSEKKESSEVSDEYYFDHKDEYYFLNKSRLNAHLHFNIRNVFSDTPHRPPQA
jgi:hypothetical protein